MAKIEVRAKSNKDCTKLTVTITSEETLTIGDIATSFDKTLQNIVSEYAGDDEDGTENKRSGYSS